ncbi:hypothetical protein PV08_05600 [Exophiala spinifera]|uniref:RING-type E3 ubiquitin transferase n=1 Tax=Exophiala spinifera TaxID=91928 RepID=A0A0D1ZS05_9EURO|nr:uncharacterized protein PV08_05600 [Exophiala spinifera]KIW15552.1 hypothetical protein PV08_05600 [Exophiala spinifera]
MRPLRFLLLLTFFITLPIALTFFSLFSLSESNADTFHTGYTPRQRSLRAFFSFQTPSSLFPPSAIISLTADNSTFFLARPAAFGPSLPSRGLSGQLWVGKGFGDDALLKEENIHIVGWELGCSDVPGWGEETSKREKNLPQVDHLQESSNKRRDLGRDGQAGDEDLDGSEPFQENVEDDGTDDYLHHPLPDSNPATPGHPGEPANIGPSDQKNPTHADIESLQESADIAGKIVMLSRGGCGFLEKVKWAQRRGGIALIVGDNERGAQLTIMYAKGDTSNVTIPAVFTSYTSAHLLASLVPPESGEDEAGSGKGSDKAAKGPQKGNNHEQQDSKPVFTSTKSRKQQPTIVPAKDSATAQTEKGWVSNVLSAIGLNENSPFSHVEDSRRPPSSGNIDWVLVEDWDDDMPVKSSKNAKPAANIPTLSTSMLRTEATASKKPGMDDFVIGVHDWRDTDLVAPKPSKSIANVVANPKAGKGSQAEATNVVKPSSQAQDALKGGSITPGSGEYVHEKFEQTNRYNRGQDRSKQQQKHADAAPVEEAKGWLNLFSSKDSRKEAPRTPASKQEQDAKAGSAQVHSIAGHQEDEDHPGLWVTLTPTSVSTSPFFDTLLVLVISPLITLTVVYALLLLRSRIRRRRWRAPKSVVERLPVRTYHTMNPASSTTSSQVASSDASSPTSPLLISSSQNASARPRPRSQTTNSVFPGSTGSTASQARNLTSPSEKGPSKFARRKRYTGRQIECVVCLEEYIDGESQVMSLPCGHEFHAECITPWLVTRRRTCPICKGDVVRSLARTDSRYEEDVTEGEQTSDDVQERAAQTTNEDVSAAIPIPTLLRDANHDVEQGHAVDAEDDVPLLNGQHAGGQNLAAARDGSTVWRSISASVSRLSGETLWRNTPVDRNR